FAASHQLVIEAAGQEALRDYAGRTLQSGRSLLVTSIGAFSDDAFFAGLSALAEQGAGRLLLASGALPAVDWMASAALAGPCTASITQSKPVASWRGTPAEALTKLDDLRAPTCFFAGTAREAAQRLPKSSNITAMLALATAGLNATRVHLVADPTSDEMHTLIEFASDAGRLKVDWTGVPSRLNQKTSADVPLNVIKALRNLSGQVVLGP
ncbi:MAG: aspartate dehydrogenase domain-containing protein, partial [Burkholderiales bacterium]